MDPIITGTIGGLVGAAILSYVSNKVSHRSHQGQLKFGIIASATFWGCFAFAAVCSYVLLFTDFKEQDLLPLLGLVSGFGIGAVYMFGEAFKVHGSFDDEGIEFSTPWTGVKSELWKDLDSVKLNAAANWYTLVFKSGKKIRLSTLLNGHGDVLERVRTLGHDI